MYYCSDFGRLNFSWISMFGVGIFLFHGGLLLCFSGSAGSFRGGFLNLYLLFNHFLNKIFTIRYKNKNKNKKPF